MKTIFEIEAVGSLWEEVDRFGERIGETNRLTNDRRLKPAAPNEAVRNRKAGKERDLRNRFEKKRSRRQSSVERTKTRCLHNLFQLRNLDKGIGIRSPWRTNGAEPAEAWMGRMGSWSKRPPKTARSPATLPGTGTATAGLNQPLRMLTIRLGRLWTLSRVGWDVEWIVSEAAMPDRDYYEVLGVSRDATADQIKAAYRKLARKHHPDMNPGDKKAEARFKEIQGAYDILSDAEKRSKYDRYGHAAFEGFGPFGPRTGASEWAARQSAGPGHFETIDLGEIFGRSAGSEDEGVGQGGMFEEILGRMRGGGRGRSRAPRAGRDVEARLTIPFETALRGGETTITLDRDGVIDTLDVKIPPGTAPGAKLRLRGRGEPGEKGAQAGSLIVHVDVEPHRYFTREGRDLYLEVPITVSEAVLGARIDVPTLDGLKTLPIPAGSSSGQKLRLRGLGAPATTKLPAGDLFVVLKITAPKNVDEESKALIRRFAERNPYNPRTGLW